MATGPGLSIINDIIKAYGGEVRVEATEGEGAEFTIELPGDTKYNLSASFFHHSSNF